MCRIRICYVKSGFSKVGWPRLVVRLGRVRWVRLGLIVKGCNVFRLKYWTVQT